MLFNPKLHQLLCFFLYLSTPCVFLRSSLHYYAVIIHTPRLTWGHFSARYASPTVHWQECLAKLCCRTLHAFSHLSLSLHHRLMHCTINPPVRFFYLYSLGVHVALPCGHTGNQTDLLGTVLPSVPLSSLVPMCCSSRGGVNQ